MLWVKLDIDVLQDGRFRALEREVPGAFWLWVRLLATAKLANQEGALATVDGDPVDGEWLRDVHPDTDLDAWEGVLDWLVRRKLLTLTDGCYRIRDWGRWNGGQKPSDAPAAVRKRVAEHREREKEKKRQNEANPTPVTPVTPVTPQSRASTEQSKAEQSKAEQSKADLPPTPKGGEEDKIFEELSPGSLSRTARSRWSALTMSVPREDALFALRQARDETLLAVQGGRQINNLPLYAIEVATQIVARKRVPGHNLQPTSNPYPEFT